ncbi:MAG: protein kinase domain-containing protein [Nocardioides sp.]
MSVTDPHPPDPDSDPPSGRPSDPPSRMSVSGYELLARIGEGGMGVVHLARQPGGDRVALKVIRPHIVGDHEARERLAQEVSSLRRIRSGRVAEILDADPWGEVPFVATRYVPGLSLAEHVEESGPLPESDLTWFAWCLAEALTDVHGCGVLHRDVKPSNVLMEGRNPVLIDFGLARVADDPKLTHTGWLLGTPGYLAPEILQGHDASPASDVHSWAATVAFAGIGRSAFGTGPSAAIMDRVRIGQHHLAGLPEPIAQVVAACLRPEPSARPTLPWLLSWLRREVSSPGEETPVLPDAAPLVEPSADTVEQQPPTQPLSYAGGPAFGLAPTGHPEHDRRPAGMTRLLAEGDADPAGDDGPAGLRPRWGGEPVEARVSTAGDRSRRLLLLAIMPVVLGLVLAAYPLLTFLGLLVTVWVLRALSATGTAHADRRMARGPRWFDGPLTAASTPWHLIVTSPMTALLVIWSSGIAVAAGLIGYALSLSAVSTLLLTGAALAVALWLGPGASAVRGPVHTLLGPVVRRTGVWAVGLALVAGLGAVAMSQVRATGTDWYPADAGPLSRVPRLPDWIR